MPGGGTFVNGRRQIRNVQVDTIYIMAFLCKQFWAPSFGGGPLDSEKWGCD